MKLYVNSPSTGPGKIIMSALSLAKDITVSRPSPNWWLPTQWFISQYSVRWLVSSPCSMAEITLPCPQLCPAGTSQRSLPVAAYQSLIQAELPQGLETDWLPQWQAHCASPCQACWCLWPSPEAWGRGGGGSRDVNTGVVVYWGHPWESLPQPQLTDSRFSERLYEF